MNILFAESSDAHLQLLPLTYTRPIANLRVGILTIDEKWAKQLAIESFGYATQEYLQAKFPFTEANDETLWIVGGILPNPQLIGQIQKLSSGKAITKENRILIAKGSKNPLENPEAYLSIEFSGDTSEVSFTWDLFRLNGQEIRNDYKLITAGRKSAAIEDPHTIVYGAENVFLEEAAQDLFETNRDAITNRVKLNFLSAAFVPQADVHGVFD